MPDQNDFARADAATALGDNSGPLPRRRNTASDGVSRLAWESVRHTADNQKFEPSADPTHSHWLQKFDLGETTKVFWGRIVDSIAYVNTYKVQCENGIPPILCTMGVQTALQPMGIKEYGQLQPGTSVYFLLHPMATYGVIIAVDPEYNTNSQGPQPDFISQAGRAGMAVDDAHKAPLRMEFNGNIGDYSSGRPYDQTCAGEKGWMAETGVGIHADSFMAYLRADEECGVWAFWHDQLLRVAGHNLQQWTACRNREDVDSNGQVDSVEGYTPFYWEALGRWRPGTPMRLLDAVAWQTTPESQGYSAVEPLDDKQQGFYRLRDFHGYIGQGCKRVLQLPPVRPATTVQTYPTEIDAPGVYEENLTLPGDKLIRTARSYLIVKRLANPSPKQIRRQEDVDADTPEDYKAAGVFGEGLAHKVVGDLPLTGSDDPSAMRASNFLDSQTYAFNWQGAHPFEYAERTWYLPEESELSYLPAMPTPGFEQLRTKHRMSAPPSITLPVDNRYEEVDYYPNMAYWGILPDGTVKIGCGFGGEITFVNGHIYIDAPGDINIRTGRNFNVMAGQDVCITGRNSVDIAANNKDLRLSANHDICAVGGLDGCGGVLIESQSRTPNLDFTGTGEDVTVGGIVLKARTSMVAVVAPLQMYVAADTATLAQWGGLTPIPPTIVVNATGGRVRTSADYDERFLGAAAMDVWPVAGVVNEYWANAVNLGASVSVKGSLAATGCGIFDGSVESVSGHFWSTQGRYVAQLASTSYNIAKDTLTRLLARNIVAFTLGEQEFAQFLAIGLDVPLLSVVYTFRSTPQYHTGDFTMFEARWQQMSRLGAGGAAGVWIINAAFTLAGVPTYPYPGIKWVEDATLRTIDPVLYNLATGLSVDRADGAYEAPVLNAPIQRQLSGNLTSIFI